MYLFVCQEFLGGGILYETLFINGFGSVNGSFDNLMYIYIYRLDVQVPTDPSVIGGYSLTCSPSLEKDDNQFLLLANSYTVQ